MCVRASAVSTNLTFSLSVDWPLAFLKFNQFFSFVNFDFMQIFALECASDAVNFYSKYGLSITMSLLLILSFPVSRLFWLETATSTRGKSLSTWGKIQHRLVGE